ncbi:MAG: UbiX family flavin prenyltransferase [Halobacteriales archaeon]
MTDRVVVGMTGSTGQVYGVRALELLRDAGVETHLVLSDAAKINLNQEGDYTPAEVKAIADEVHDVKNVGAKPASGSFRTRGMLVAPCSMKTLSNVAHGNAGDLITRSADVMLKERRPLVVMPREKPFNRIHLENMLAVTDAGGIIMPPFPSFYQQPDTLEEMVTRTMARALDQLGLDIDYEEWSGLST